MGLTCFFLNFHLLNGPYFISEFTPCCFECTLCCFLDFQVSAWTRPRIFTLLWVRSLAWHGRCWARWKSSWVGVGGSVDGCVGDCVVGAIVGGDSAWTRPRIFTLLWVRSLAWRGRCWARWKSSWARWKFHPYFECIKYKSNMKIFVSILSA